MWIIYEQRLYDLKDLIVVKFLDNHDQYLLNNRELNRFYSIAYLQLLLILTIEFPSKSLNDNQQFLHYIFKTLFTLYLSFMLKLRHNQRQQYLHLSLTPDKQLDQIKSC
ncbi:unnamed protein product [Rotaria sordida]|uniref:Transmembrane protein n=1 Tax=Rotaria sordida TaxID=392033 RepID=A0A819I7Q6_9BILA|nr:unnamed protein product [Rotaria sordida]